MEKYRKKSDNYGIQFHKSMILQKWSELVYKN